MTAAGWILAALFGAAFVIVAKGGRDQRDALRRSLAEAINRNHELHNEIDRLSNIHLARLDNNDGTAWVAKLTEIPDMKTFGNVIRFDAFARAEADRDLTDDRIDQVLSDWTIDPDEAS